MLAEFGEFVLDHEDLNAVLTEACRLIAALFGAGPVRVIEVERGADTGLVRAAAGWQGDGVGKERIPLSAGSAEALAIDAKRPVVTSRIAEEDHFRIPQVLSDAGVVALVTLPIILPGRRPWGILQVGSPVLHRFDGDEIEFLSAYAVVLGPVIDRCRAVRERAQALEDLARREERLQDILDGMGEGFGILAPDFTIIEHNQEATRMDGRSREEIVGRSHWDAYPGIEDTELGRALKRAMSERVPTSLEHSVTLANGIRRRLETRARPTRDGALGVFWRDVTERHRAITALRDSEARLVALFESVPVAIAAIDTEGKVVLANQPFLRLFPTRTIPSRDPQNVGRWQGWDASGRALAPSDFPGARALRGQAVLPGLEMLFTQPDGNKIWTNVATVPTRDQQGRVTGLVTVITDISESKAAEAKLRASEVRLQTLIEGIPQLVWRGAKDGSWTWSSPQWTDFTGIGAEASLGDGWLAALHPDDREAAREAWASAGSTGMLEFEARIRSASTGEHCWFQTRARAVRDETGRIVEWLGTSTDVNELRDLQERQRALVAELQHRTRNLLAVVRSMADRTASGSRDFEEFRAKYHARLDALARVQGLLSRLGPNDRVTFDELIDTELAAMHGGDNNGSLMLQGPKGVRLRSTSVQTLAMAVHELATNAVKYGALSQPGAHLEVVWSFEPGTAQSDPKLHIHWRESGVTMPLSADAARRIGQGRELIEQVLPYQLGARTHYEFTPDGVCCSISVSVSKTPPQDHAEA